MTPFKDHDLMAPRPAGVSSTGASRENARLTTIIAAQRDVMAAGLELEAVMQLVVENAQALTRATAAAIELADGDDMVYRAASGTATSSIGLRLKKATSLSGLCVKTGKILSCADAELDARVDRDACRRIGVRSMIVVPLRHESVDVGVLKVMAPAADAFVDEDLATLQVMAGFVSAAMAHAASKKALRTSEQRLRAVIELASDAVVTIDRAGKVVFWNDRATRMFGYEAAEMVGQPLTRLMEEANARAHTAAVGAYAPSRPSSVVGGSVELVAVRKGGATFPVELSVSRWNDGDGELFFTSIMRDISARKQQQNELREAEEQFRLTFDHAPIGIAIVGLDGRWTRVNQALCAIVGYSSEELLELTFQDITHPDDLASDLTLLHRLVAGEIPRYQLGKRYIRKDGSFVDVMLHVSMVREQSGRGRHFISQIEDITARKRLEVERLERARTDHLTGLLGRGAGEEGLARELERARRHQLPLSVALLDLDHFKRINDTYGHGAGDDVLRATGKLIAEACRSLDVAVRWGGEELLVVLPHTDLEGARQFAERVRRGVASLAVHPVTGVTASAGLATLVEGDSIDQLIARADQRLYEAKHGGRNQVR